MAKKITRTEPEVKAVVKAETVKKAKKIVKAEPAKQVEPAPSPMPFPQVYVDAKRQTFMRVGENAGVAGFLTMRNNQVTVEYLSDISELKMVACTKSFQEAARPYITSKLPKSPLAGQVLDAIIDSKDRSQTDFISGLVAKNAANLKANPKTTKTPKTNGATHKAAKTQAGLISLGDILDELKMDGKKARIILRKNLTKPDAGWAWPADQKAAVVKLLKGE